MLKSACKKVGIEPVITTSTSGFYDNISVHFRDLAKIYYGYDNPAFPKLPSAEAHSTSVGNVGQVICDR
jgi:hypothetical protein